MENGRLLAFRSCYAGVLADLDPCGFGPLLADLDPLLMGLSETKKHKTQETLTVENENRKFSDVTAYGSQ